MNRFSIKQLLLAVTFLCITFAGLSRYFTPRPFAGQTHDVNGSTYTHFAWDQQFDTTVSSELIEVSPAWHPADANPPVSARAALQIADRIRRERLRDRNNWRWGLESIRLVPLDSENGKWCWLILFEAYPEAGGLGGVPPEYPVFVLMDGCVIPSHPSGHRYEEWGIVEADALGEVSSE